MRSLVSVRLFVLNQNLNTSESLQQLLCIESVDPTLPAMLRANLKLPLTVGDGVEVVSSLPRSNYNTCGKSSCILYYLHLILLTIDRGYECCSCGLYQQIYNH